MLILLITLATQSTAQETVPDFVKCDPTKVLGADACNKCHQQEINQWWQTPHYRTFDTLHRKPEAKAIAKKLGLRSVKRNDTCVKCHYTQKEVRGRLRVVSGVSCESCHGAAQDWVNLHADYGGPNVKKQDESPGHKAKRRIDSIAAGMNNPSDLYLIARQCLACHTTPEEKLVNVGGHNAGSEGFELVAWSQGIVRHNFQRTDGKTNAPSSVERLRLMYLVGALTDLEFSLRAVAKATTAEQFGKTAAERAARAKQRLWEAQRRLDNKQLAQALDAVSKVELTLGNAKEIEKAADEIGRVARSFSREANGAALEALDALLPKPEEYKR